MQFKQWLSNQSSRTFKILNSNQAGQFVLQIGFQGSVEGEIDNLTETDLKTLLSILKLRFENLNRG